MPVSVRILAVGASLLALAILAACTGGGSDSADSTSVAARALGEREYAQLLCTQVEATSSEAFDAFAEAADAYEAAAGDTRAEAASVGDWGLASGEAWLALSLWAGTIEPPEELTEYHKLINVLFLDLGRERALLGLEVSAETDPDRVWILVQRAWALTLLEPLRLISANGMLPGSMLDEFASRPCGPLFVVEAGSRAAGASEQAIYAAQSCWLYQLAWDEEQLSFQDLALIPDRGSTLDEVRLPFSTFTRREQRTQLLMELGLQSIVPPDGLSQVHDALSLNAAARLGAAFGGEQAVDAALSEDDLNTALNALLVEFLDFAQALAAIRDAAPVEFLVALDARDDCGALDGREVAFYGELTS
jgi:hypothetical protein